MVAEQVRDTWGWEGAIWGERHRLAAAVERSSRVFGCVEDTARCAGAQCRERMCVISEKQRSAESDLDIQVASAHPEVRRPSAFKYGYEPSDCTAWMMPCRFATCY